MSCQITLLKAAGEPAATAKFDAWLAVAFDWRGSDAPKDLITFHGGQALLQPVHVQEISNFDQLGAIGGISHWMAVPKDEDLEGVIVLFQWYVQSKEKPDDIAVSEVLGARIWSSAEKPRLPLRVAPAEGHAAARTRFQQELSRSSREGAAERFAAVRGAVELRLRAR